MENNDRGRIGQATRDVKDYAALYADRLRLGLIENLSTFFNALFGVVVLIVLLWIAAMFFAVALTWVIGMLIGSMLGAILLMGGLFVVLAAIVYAVRRRLIVDQMARMFGKMVYDMRKKRSPQDVKIERLRVENELDAVERRLRDDYRGISKMFSVGYLMEQITGKANLIYNIVQWSMSGYNFVHSMIDKYKAMNAERSGKNSGETENDS